MNEPVAERVNEPVAEWVNEPVADWVSDAVAVRGHVRKLSAVVQQSKR